MPLITSLTWPSANCLHSCKSLITLCPQICQVQVRFSTSALVTPSILKALILKYMKAFSFYSFRYLLKFVTWACNSVFISYFYHYHSTTYKLFLVVWLYKQCRSVNIFENFPGQYLPVTNLCCSWNPGSLRYGCLKYAR